MEVDLKIWTKKTLKDVILEFGLDAATQEYTLITGSGTIVYTKHSVQFKPTRGHDPVVNQQPQVADEVLKARRLGSCVICLDYAGNCTIAGCKCNGMGQPERLLSRCPKGHW